MIAIFSVALAAAVSASKQAYTSGPDGRTCVCKFAHETDYFPVKLQPDHSAHWTISYHKSYKIINNTQTNQTFVGYLCGTPEPTGDAVPEGATVLSLPLQDVGITSTTYIPLMEFIGQRQNVKYYDSSMEYVHSPCLRRLAEESKVVTPVIEWPPPDYQESEQGGRGSALLASGVQAVFCGKTCTSLRTALEGKDNAPMLIGLSETEEPTPLGTQEWVEFIAAFFNREVAAQHVVSLTRDRMTCNAQQAQSQKKPNILWISEAWNSDGQLFDIADCPNFYCDLIEQAGGTLLTHELFESSPNSYGIGYQVTLQKLLASALLASVDVVVYSNYYNSRTTSVWEQLAERVPAVARGNVFDIQGSTSWFETRPVQPDVLLLDLIHVMHPELVPYHERRFLRKAAGADEEPIATAPAIATCDDITAPLTSEWMDLDCLELRSAPGSPVPVMGTEPSTGPAQDDSTYVGLYGPCSSYAEGQDNHIFCESDNVLDICPKSCSTCPDGMAKLCMPDSLAWASVYGSCATYALGQPNHDYCEEDGAAEPCAKSCSGWSSCTADECVDDAYFTSEYGICASYEFDKPNHIYCGADKVERFCPRACNVCGKTFPCEDSVEFDKGYGPCDTYYRGQSNFEYCASDLAVHHCPKACEICS